MSNAIYQFILKAKFCIVTVLVVHVNEQCVLFLCHLHRDIPVYLT